MAAKKAAKKPNKNSTKNNTRKKVPAKPVAKPIAESVETLIKATEEVRKEEINDSPDVGKMVEPHRENISSSKPVSTGANKFKYNESKKIIKSLKERIIPKYPEIKPEDYKQPSVSLCKLPKDTLYATYDIKALFQQLKSRIRSNPERFYVIIRTLKVLTLFLEHHFKIACKDKGYKFTDKENK